MLQTILIPLLYASAPSRLFLDGGTHNMQAPPFDFIARSFLPIINRMGPTVEARLIRHGFYPRGGGRIEVSLTPAPLRPIACEERGALRRQTATALFAGLPFDIANREISVARSMLDWPEEAFAVRELPGEQGPGNALLLEAEFDNATEIVTGFGQLGVTAERIARTAAGRMNGYLESSAFAGPYLADQLMLPFALARGSRFTTVSPSQHALTAADISGRFTGRPPRVSQRTDGVHAVSFV